MEINFCRWWIIMFLSGYSLWFRFKLTLNRIGVIVDFVHRNVAE